MERDRQRLQVDKFKQWGRKASVLWRTASTLREAEPKARDYAEQTRRCYIEVTGRDEVGNVGACLQGKLEG